MLIQHNKVCPSSSEITEQTVLVLDNKWQSPWTPKSAELELTQPFLQCNLQLQAANVKLKNGLLKDVIDIMNIGVDEEKVTEKQKRQFQFSVSMKSEYHPFMSTTIDERIIGPYKTYKL